MSHDPHAIVIPAADVSKLVKELARRISEKTLEQEVGGRRELDRLSRNDLTFDDAWKLLRVANRHGLFSLLSNFGLPPVTYNIDAAFQQVQPPLGFSEVPPEIPLVARPTSIAGHQVDFPLALPASVLATNSKWIEFYARRGFDILTYKTVRSQYRRAHSSPNWLFVKNPDELQRQFRDDMASAVAIAERDYWPPTLDKATMANSFGVPSFGPGWWTDDVRNARQCVREGHQVLIVSIIASVEGDGMRDDFVHLAKLAKDAGADIIEANYSCPNVCGDRVGELYQDPEASAAVSEAVREAVHPTPVFVKIGYLAKAALRGFVEKNSRHIDGIVAINTISADVVDSQGRPVFPDASGGKPRKRAGMSGWAIKAMAQETVRQLVKWRSEPDLLPASGNPLTVIGLGGILNKDDVNAYLSIGADAAGSCTGAFLNPNLALEARFDHAAAEHVVRAARSKEDMRMSTPMKILTYLQALYA